MATRSTHPRHHECACALLFAFVALQLSDPEPTDPEPTGPEPTDPEPTDPEPTDPEHPAQPSHVPQDRRLRVPRVQHVHRARSATCRSVPCLHLLHRQQIAPTPSQGRRPSLRGICLQCPCLQCPWPSMLCTFAPSCSTVMVWSAFCGCIARSSTLTAPATPLCTASRSGVCDTCTGCAHHPSAMDPARIVGVEKSLRCTLPLHALTRNQTDRVMRSRVKAPTRTSAPTSYSTSINTSLCSSALARDKISLTLLRELDKR